MALETLTAIFQHYIWAVPFENLNIHYGETIELDMEIIHNRIVGKKCGEWCMENNHLLFCVFQAVGYVDSILGGNIYDTTESYSIGCKSYIVDGVFGASYQRW